MGKKISANEVVRTTGKQEHDKLYNDYVKAVTPVHNKWVNLGYAYLVGGLICVFGQICTNLFLHWGCEKETAQICTTITLVFLAVLATGINLYQKLAKYAGAGSLVPITGFANSVAAPAIEFQKEGQVFGIGCKIFTIAGPVILYGILTSWVLGIGYWILTLVQ